MTNNTSKLILIAFLTILGFKTTAQSINLPNIGALIATINKVKLQNNNLNKAQNSTEGVSSNVVTIKVLPCSQPVAIQAVQTEKRKNEFEASSRPTFH
jgi:TRAP-type mannitol/chloroaromatic compound transport system permease large subunit